MGSDWICMARMALSRLDIEGISGLTSFEVIMSETTESYCTFSVFD